MFRHERSERTARGQRKTLCAALSGTDSADAGQQRHGASESVHGRAGRRDDRQAARRQRRQRSLLLERARSQHQLDIWKRPPTTGGGWSWGNATCRRSARATNASSSSTASRSARCCVFRLESETRGNIHVGGQCVKTEVTARDREICAALAPLLRADGLYFVGLDVIGKFSHRSQRDQPHRHSGNQCARRRALGKPSDRFRRTASRKNSREIRRILDSPALLRNISAFTYIGQVAQSVEQRTENPRVGGSIPSLATISPYIFQLVTNVPAAADRIGRILLCHNFANSL